MRTKTLEGWALALRTKRARAYAAIRFAFALAALLLAAASQAQGALYSWSTSSGDWSVASNWGGILPTSSDVAYIVNGGTVNVTQLGESCGTLALGSAAGSGNLQMSAGSLYAPAYESVGDTGTGTFMQSGGTNTIGDWFFAGNKQGSSGTYSLSGSGQMSAPFEYVGNLGTGTFNQSGGTNTGSYLWISCASSSSGSYTLSGSGLLSPYTEDVGYFGPGSFTQSGGTNNSSFLYVGYAGPPGGAAVGTYSLSGSGQMSAGTEYLGYSGTGTFTQSGGSNGAGTLYVGYNSTGSGTYNLNGGTLGVTLLSAGSGSAAFNFNGGTLRASGGFSSSLPMTLGTSGGGATFDTAGFNVTLTGSLSGPGSLTKVDSGILTLTATNSYANGTTIAGGTLRITNNSALGGGTILLAGGTLGLAGISQNGNIGIHFVGNGSSVTGSAGVVAMSNWNNLSGTSFTNTALTDNSGLSTTANLTTSGVNSMWASGSSNQLLNGYIAAYNYGKLSATFNNIPYSSYSIYAYMADSTTGNDEKVTIGGTSYYYGTTNSASYIQVTNSSSASYPLGNYVVATGLSGGSQTISVQGTTQTYGSFTGFEIVNTGSSSSTINPLTLTNNAVTLSANSAIDVTGPPSAAVTSLLTIGGYQLSLTGGGSGANTAYSLTLGNSGGVSLTGNPTFDVANNGTGAGTLILGALNDGGTARTITKSDVGVLTLATAAIAMNSNDIVNVAGGTLNSNNAAALGALTAVNVASGAALSLGASQTLAALGDTGTVVANGASVLLNGNALTVGSGNNLSSTFSGVISDGTGGPGVLIKMGTGLLTLSGNNTYSGGTTLSAGSLQIGNGGTSGSLGAGPVLNNGALLSFSQSGVYSVAAAISGSGGLAQFGPGTVVLNAADSYAGTTTIGGGALRASSGAGLPGNSGLTLNGGVLEGSGSFTRSVNSSNTGVQWSSLGGGFSANGGTLTVNLGNGAVLSWGTSASQLQGPLLFGSLTANNVTNFLNSVNLNGANQTISVTAGLGGDFAEISGTFYNSSGTAGLTKTGNGLLVLAGSNTYNGSTTLAAGELSISTSSILPTGSPLVFNGGILQITGTAITSLAGVSVNGTTFNGGFDIANAVNVFTVSNALSGTGSLSKLGPGALFVTASNGYSGGTTLSAGLLQVGNASALGLATNSLAMGGGTLDLHDYNVSLGSLSGGGTIDNLSGTASYTLGVGYDNSSSTFSGTLRNTTGQIALMKAGTGTLMLTGSNAYSGGTTISAGLLQVGNTSALGPVNNSLTVGGTLDLHGYNLSVGALSGGGTIDNLSGAASYTLGVGYDNSSSTFSGTLQNTSGQIVLTKAGTGTLTLTGNVSLGSSCTVNGGALNQLAGTATFANSLYLGYNPGSAGAFNLSGTGTLWAVNEYAGYAGAGTFTQSGGTNTSIGLNLGLSASGSYILSGSGLLTSYGETVGDFSSATFTQSGGTNNVSSYSGLYVGFGAGSSGFYTLGGSGMLSATGASEYVGYSGSGALTQSGGTNNLAGGSLYLGNSLGASGSYSLGGSGVLSAASEYVGSSGTGTFNQTGGSNSVNCLSIGPQGRYNLSGGTLQVTAGFTNQGIFNAGGGTGVLSAANAIVDMTGGSQSNGSMGLSIGPNSLLLLPAGVSTSTFSSYTNQGLLHNVGSTLNVSSGTGFAGIGSIADFVNCQGTISAAAGGWINLNGGVAISGAGSVNLGSGSLSVNSAVASISGGSLSAYSETVGASGAGTFIQSGGTNTVSSLFSLAGSSTYTLSGGALIVPGIQGNGGTFNLGGGTLIATAGFSASQAMSLTGSGGNGNINTGGNAITLGGVLSGPGGLNISGGGVLTLAVGNSFSGNTVVSGGSLVLGNSLALQNSSLDTTGASLSFGSLVSATFGGLLNGGSLVLANTAGSSVALSVGGNNANTTYSGALSGAGNMTKIGAGSLTLNNANTYSGPTVIAGGTLRLGYNVTPAPSTATLSMGGAPAYAGSYSMTGGSMTISGEGADFWDSSEQGYFVYKSVPTNQNFDVAVRIATMSGGDAVWAKAGIMARQDTSSTTTGGLGNGYGANTIIDAETTSAGCTLQYSNSGVDTTAGTSVGPNWLRLTYNASTGLFTGYESSGSSSTMPTAWTTIGSYTVSMTGSSFLLGIADTSHNSSLVDTAVFSNVANLFTSGNASLPAATALSIAASSTFDLNGGTQTVTSLADYNYNPLLGGGNILNSNTAAAVLTLSPTSGSTTFSGMIQGGGTLGALSLVMSGNGVQVLAGSNSYGGGTTISAGTLQLGNASALGAGGLTMASGAVLDLHGNSLTAAGGYALPSLLGLGTITDYSMSAGPTTMFAVQQAGNTTYSGTLLDGPTRSIGLALAGSGLLNLSTSNGYSGGTSVSGGTLQLGNAAALGNAAVTGIGGYPLSIASATFDLNGYSPTVGALSGNSGAVIANSAGANSVSLTTNTTFATTFAGTIANSGGGISLVKMGSGALTLTGTGNAYSGGTVLNAGMLVLANGASGSALGSGNVTINGGTLTTAGGGAISGTILSGSGAYVIAPGSSLTPYCDLMVGGLSTGSNLATLHFDLGSPVASHTYNGDLITVNSAGLLSIGANTTIALSSLPTVGGDYRLLADSNSGALAGVSLSNFVLPTAPARTTYALSTSAESGYLDLVVIPALINPSYTLAAAATSHSLIVGGSSSIAVTLTNTGGTSADGITYSGLTAITATGGTINGLPGSGSVAASSSASTSGLSFTSNTPGSYAITPVASVSGSNGTTPSLASTGTDAVTVMDHSNASLSSIAAQTSETISFGNFLLGASVPSQTFTIYNLAANTTAAYTTNLKLTNFAQTGDLALTTNLANFSGLLAGSAGKTFTASLNTGSTTVSGIKTISLSASQLVDDSSLPGAGSNNNGAITITLQGTVGSATADASNSPTSFGSPMTAPVAPNASYANLESTVAATTGSGGQSMVGSTATLLAGTASVAANVSMAWRTAASTEGLVSDVVDLTGLGIVDGQTKSGSVHTDTFVLQMTYSPQAVTEKTGLTELAAAQGELIQMDYLDGSVDQWEPAVLGNFGSGSDHFVGVEPWNNDMNLGDWGVNTINHSVWAVLDHNSEFAVTPEPSTFVLLAAGAVSLAGYVWRRRRKHSRSLTGQSILSGQDETDLQDAPVILGLPSRARESARRAA